MAPYWTVIASMVVTLAIATAPLNSTAVERGSCPIDHMIFEDSASHRQFVAESFSFEPNPNCRDPNCRSQFGKTTIAGKLDGADAYAIFTVNDSAPCCMWYSYNGKPSFRRIVILGKSVPTIAFGSEWNTIGQPNPPFESDIGPMGGAKFVPSRCRK